MGTDCTYEVFRARRHELAWLNYTRPYQCAAVPIHSRVMDSKFDKAAIILLNSTISSAQTMKEKINKQQGLDLQLLRIIGFSDSSFANFENLERQLGYAIFLGAPNKRVNWPS